MFKNTIALLLALFMLLCMASFAAAGPPGPVVASVLHYRAMLDEVLKVAIPVDWKSFASETFIACGECQGQHYLVDYKGAEASRTKYTTIGTSQGTMVALMKMLTGDWAHSEPMAPQIV